MQRKGTIDDLAAIIKEAAKSHGHFVIALAGFGGAGKSTAAKDLADALDNAIVVPLDEFIIDRLSDRSSDWAGFDWTRLVEQVLKPIRDGKEVVIYGVYDWSQNKIIEEKTLQLPQYVIIEGCGLIRDQLKKYFDFSVWIDVPLDVASQRGSARDREAHTVDHDSLWNERWTPNDKDYFEKYQPEKNADFLLEI